MCMNMVCTLFHRTQNLTFVFDLKTHPLDASGRQLVILNKKNKSPLFMDMARYVPSQQVGNVEDDYLKPSPEVPYYINLAITGHNGIVVPY